MVLEEAVQVESHCCHQDETVVHEALERPVVVADQEEKAEIRQILHLLMVDVFGVIACRESGDGIGSIIPFDPSSS